MRTLSSGNLLVAGTGAGTVSIGNKSLISAGGDDIFIAEIDPSGQFIYADRFGGSGADNVVLASTSNGTVLWGGKYSSGFEFNAKLTTLLMGSATNAFVGVYRQRNATYSATRPIPFSGCLDHGGRLKDHSLFLKEDGSLWASGKNDFGQTGIDQYEYLDDLLSYPSNFSLSGSSSLTYVGNPNQETVK